ncbi:MAG: carbamoyl-phosphate synthase large subunit [Acidimicrobiia bacterium]|nr:carbamoyl-phosphate synthase large subunit [Acidimicrobiia bacterium]
MSPTSLLVANRGEIAVRILRGAAELGIRTVAVYSEDDVDSLHVRRADEARALAGRGAAAYLDGEQLLAVAEEAGCEAVHPGYGFLSENAAFAKRCAERGVTFVGPRAETLALFGDKVAARALASRCGVAVLRGTSQATSLEEAQEFLAGLGEGGAMMIKALAGGGGRGMRAVTGAAEVEEAYTRCRSEARASFGNDEVYAEQLIARARHIEIQVLGDGTGTVTHLGERECSLQRRHQKIVEVAPSPGLHPGLRARLAAAAVRMAAEVRYGSLGTFEFLVDADAAGTEDAGWAFIEANARLQVEHTVTEEVTGVDLVQAQLRLAGGRTLAELGLTQGVVPAPRGHAIQVRVNMETMQPDGTTRPAGGTLSAFEVPSGPGLRTDTFGYVGYRTSPAFDSLLAKLIGHSPSADFADAVARTYRALCEFKIEGVATNLGFLQSLLRHPDVAANRVYTRFVDDHVAELAAPDQPAHRRLFHEAPAAARLAGVKVDRSDPLAVLHHGKTAGEGVVAITAAAEPFRPRAVGTVAGPEGSVAVEAPMQGTIVSIDVAEGDPVHAGQQVVVMEAMKMEHVIGATASGVVTRIDVTVGDTVFEAHPLLFVEEGHVEVASLAQEAEVDLDEIRPDLAEVVERHGYTLDENRPDSVERRRKTGQRTARENVEDLVDEGSFSEYAPLVIAAQRRRRTVEDLIARTPADGMIAGVGRVNGHLFEDDRARCAVLSYDYTVLAGTQGQQNHRKKDRLFELAERWRLPVVFFTEGGGGRPGDTDGIGAAGLDTMAFTYFGRLSGLVPLVGVNSGRCFAGNAAILGCCDVVIATEDSTIGMGGPAMIEGGGLGVFRPEEVGPMHVQVPNGVVDVVAKDEAEAVEQAKRYLSYFQGPVPGWECADQRLLRRAIPENRLRVYDVRQVIETLADTGSVLELRRHFGVGMLTSLVRIEGRPLGVIANNPTHLGGAIDSDGADKAARFMQLCDAYNIPILMLCDTPGMMVGPEVEKTALVRHCSRMFVVGASVTVPFFTIVLRKGYGLGAQAMAGGSFKANMFTVSWPTGEFGGMGLEGAVKLGYRNELAAIEDPEERTAAYEERVAKMYEHGKAISSASYFEIDDVIDPMESRRWVTGALRSVPAPEPRAHKKRPCIDTW